MPVKEHDWKSQKIPIFKSFGQPPSGFSITPRKIIKASG